MSSHVAPAHSAHVSEAAATSSGRVRFSELSVAEDDVSQSPGPLQRIVPQGIGEMEGLPEASTIGASGVGASTLEGSGWSDAAVGQIHGSSMLSPGEVLEQSAVLGKDSAAVPTAPAMAMAPPHVEQPQLAHARAAEHLLLKQEGFAGITSPAGLAHAGGVQAATVAQSVAPA
eukprot:4451066-Amphidinium_carterae.1